VISLEAEMAAKKKEKRTKITYSYRKGKIELWWDKQVRGWRKFVLTARWVALGMALMWLLVFLRGG
jgi:hypothetical protein